MEHVSEITPEQIKDFADEFTRLHIGLDGCILGKYFYLNTKTYMTWCYGKGYISREKYNEWLKEMMALNPDAEDSLKIFYSDKNEYWTPYAVVTEDSSTMEGYEKATHILAEFILSIDAYKERWNHFKMSNCNI